jgi:mono/diheme cytochrome c family protein
MRALVASGLVAIVAMSTRSAVEAQDTLKTLKDEGQVVYSRECSSCHGADGTGEGAGPSLVGNTSLANKAHVITRILTGSTDKGMDPFAKVLNDRDVAAVATFVRNAWENAYGIVLESDVKDRRDEAGQPR